MIAERRQRERYYDAANERLVYIGTEATPEMWDSLWLSDENAMRNALAPGRGTRYVTDLTARFVTNRGARILEGGSGLGHILAALQRAGYDSIGIDFAPKTVAALNRIAPELRIVLGDLRSLPFDAHAFDAYWSLGVIEHFFCGYRALASEMARVIRPGGYLFLTFPHMSPLRQLRARTGGYPPFQSTTEPAGFYQFALDPDRVLTDLARLGFRQRHRFRMSGLEGIKDELPLLRQPLHWLHDYAGKAILIRAIRFFIDRISAVIGGHTCVLVLQKSA